MRYAVMSDIHANIYALDAVVADVRTIRAADALEGRDEIKFWFLGDLVGYGPDPIACLKWFKSKIRGRWVPGDHDEWAFTGHIPSEANFPVQQTISHHRELLLDPLNKRWTEWFFNQIASVLADDVLARSIEIFDDLHLIFTHACLPAPITRTHYLFPWVSDLSAEFAYARALLGEGVKTALQFCGHTHFPMWAKEGDDGACQFQSIRYNYPLPLGDGFMIINPGSVGQPRDGDLRASYAIIDTDARTIEFRRVSYANEEAANAVRQLNYDESLALRLESADGGGSLQQYHTIYRPPLWDLEVIN